MSQKPAIESFPAALKLPQPAPAALARPVDPAQPALGWRSLALAAGWVAALLLLWEIGVRLAGTPVYILPAPSRIIAVLAANPSLYAAASLVTFGEALAGLLLGALLGMGMAAVLSLLPALQSGLLTLAVLLKSTPLVVIAPLLTLWLGFGPLPKVIITALLTFFPLLINVFSGLNSVDPALLETFRSWHASRSEIFWHLRLPSALPFFFAGLKVSAPLALVGAVVAEWSGASSGLGRLMWLAYTNLNLPYLFAAVFILCAAGMLLYTLLDRLEARLIFWR